MELITILPNLGLLLVQIRQSRRAGADQANQALLAISTALTETRLYFRDYMDSNIRDLVTEGKLAQIWAAAAIPIRVFDKDLAERCERKSEYWLNPGNWDQSEIESAGISLGEMAEKYHAVKKLL